MTDKTTFVTAKILRELGYLHIIGTHWEDPLKDFPHGWVNSFRYHKSGGFSVKQQEEAINTLNMFKIGQRVGPYSHRKQEIIQELVF